MNVASLPDAQMVESPILRACPNDGLKSWHNRKDGVHASLCESLCL